MANNPFETPGSESDSARPAGEIDVMEAVRTALRALAANWVGALAVWFLGGLVYFVSCCSMVLWIATLPWLVWGVTRWFLASLDGKGSLRVLWSSPAEDLFTSWARGWGFIGVIFVAMLPPIGVSTAISLIGQGQGASTATAYSLVSSVVLMGWSIVTIRLYQAAWYIAERRTGVIDGFSRSWADSAAGWGQLAGLVVFWSVLWLPYQLATVYGSTWFQALPLGRQMEVLPGFYAALLLGSSVTSLAGMAYFFVLGAIYRQLYPEPPAETV